MSCWPADFAGGGPVPGPGGTGPGVALAPYTTDERIYQRVPLHWRALVPSSQVWAAGVDGGTTDLDPWALQSTDNDFAASGITPGMVLVITGPRSVYGEENAVYVVDQVDVGDPHTVHTRRVGANPGAGYAPGPAGGLDGIEFHVPTLMPQVVTAGAAIDARFGVGLGAYRQRSLMTPASLVQAEALCVALVLRDQFPAMARSFYEAGQGLATFVALGREWAARADALWRSFVPQFLSPEPNPTPRRFSALFRV